MGNGSKGNQLVHTEQMWINSLESINNAVPLINQNITPPYRGKTMKIYILVNEMTLTLSQTTNFRLFQSERVCRRQFHDY